MATILVLLVKGVVFRQVTQVDDARLQCAMFFMGSALTSIGFETPHIHPEGYARAATIAIRSVSEQTASTKAFGHQFGIGVVVNQMAWRGHLGPCLPVIQVTAGVRRGGVKLQGLKW